MDFYSSIADNYDYIFPLSMPQVKFVKEQFPTPLSGYQLLDIGCGTGSLTLELAKSFGKVHGIDLDKEMIGKAHVKMPHDGSLVHFQVGNMLALHELFASNQFNGVLCFGNTLVHLSSLEDIRNFFQQTLKMLKPGGKLLVQVINYNRILEQEINALATIDNEQVEFVRHYLYLKDEHKINFKTKLTIKATGQQIVNEQMLLPVRQEELIEMATHAGYSVDVAYGSFTGALLTEHSVPFILSLVKPS